MSSTQIESDKRPNPRDFVSYLPWACNQLQVETNVLVIKLAQTEYVSVDRGAKTKSGKSMAKIQTSKIFDSDKDNKSDNLASFADNEEDMVKIYAIYDSADNLLQIKFDKNKHIPRLIIKIIALIAKFQPYLTTISINQGLNQYIIYELLKFLPVVNVTEVFFDNSYIKEANYYILLETTNRIKYLSLSRCSINDDVLKTIADTLVYPKPSSKTLCLLNLSTNRITDIGANYLADMLRTNRQLYYLNIADNMITDSGANTIFSILKHFPLTFEESLISKYRLMEYLKRKNDIVNRILTDLRFGDADKKDRRKAVKPAVVGTPKKLKGLEKESSLKSMPELKNTNEDIVLLEKANVLAENELGEFKDPFNKANTVTKEGTLLCYGNNCLCYLNISYNNLSYISVRMLLEVLDVQRKNNRKPKGLIKANIEGNILPNDCKELNEIDLLLEMGLVTSGKVFTTGKGRGSGKTISR